MTPLTTPIERMTCPGCGARMNPHAEKVVAPRTRAEAARADEAMGGVIEEIHQCPACKRIETRSGT